MKTVKLAGFDNEGSKKVTVEDSHIKAATTLPIFWKNYRPWMLEVEEAVKNGGAVALVDLAYMADIAIDRSMTDEQRELKAELLELYHEGRKAA